jgi:hypothetical protein
VVGGGETVAGLVWHCGASSSLSLSFYLSGVFSGVVKVVGLECVQFWSYLPTSVFGLERQL